MPLHVVVETRIADEARRSRPGHDSSSSETLTRYALQLTLEALDSYLLAWVPLCNSVRR